MKIRRLFFLKKGGYFLCSWVFQLCFQTLLVLRTARRSVLVKRRLFPFLCLFALLTSFSPSGRRSEDRCRLRSVISPLSIIHFPLNFVPLHLIFNYQLSIVNCTSQLRCSVQFGCARHNLSKLSFCSHLHKLSTVNYQLSTKYDLQQHR